MKEIIHVSAWYVSMNKIKVPKPIPTLPAPTSLFLPFCSLGIPWAQSPPVTEVNLCLLFLHSSPQTPLPRREPLARSLVPSATQHCVFILLWYSSRFPSDCIMYKGPQVTRSVSSLFPSEVPSERLPENESCSVVPNSATPWII